jgi:type I site-specific restriction endonuclease
MSSPVLHIPFSAYDFKIRKEENQSFIFDIIRKKYLLLTPEEWIRQHWIHFLIEEKKYPRSLIAVEMPLKVNRLEKRCDIVVYGKNGKPQLIVECKSGTIKMSQKVFEQIARYNLTLRVKYLVISNGRDTFCCEIDFEKQDFSFIKELPPASAFL